MFSITTMVNGLLPSPRVQHVLCGKMVGSGVVWDGAQLTLRCSFERWGDSSLFFILILCQGKWNIKAISWRLETVAEGTFPSSQSSLVEISKYDWSRPPKALVRTLIDLESNLSETWFLEPHPASLQRSPAPGTFKEIKTSPLTN